MKVIDIDTKSQFVRHWFRWYRVGRSGLKWEPLKPYIKNEKPLRGRPEKDAIDAAAESLAEAHPTADKINPPITIDK